MASRAPPPEYAKTDAPHPDGVTENCVRIRITRGARESRRHFPNAKAVSLLPAGPDSSVRIRIQSVLGPGSGGGAALTAGYFLTPLIRGAWDCFVPCCKHNSCLPVWSYVVQRQRRFTTQPRGAMNTAHPMGLNHETGATNGDTAFARLCVAITKIAGALWLALPVPACCHQAAAPQRTQGGALRNFEPHPQSAVSPERIKAEWRKPSGVGHSARPLDEPNDAKEGRQRGQSINEVARCVATIAGALRIASRLLACCRQETSPQQPQARRPLEF